MSNQLSQEQYNKLAEIACQGEGCRLNHCELYAYFAQELKRAELRGKIEVLGSYIYPHCPYPLTFDKTKAKIEKEYLKLESELVELEQKEVEK